MYLPVDTEGKGRLMQKCKSNSVSTCVVQSSSSEMHCIIVLELFQEGILVCKRANGW